MGFTASGLAEANGVKPRCGGRGDADQLCKGKAGAGPDPNCPQRQWDDRPASGGQARV